MSAASTAVRPGAPSVSSTRTSAGWTEIENGLVGAAVMPTDTTAAATTLKARVTRVTISRMTEGDGVEPTAAAEANVVPRSPTENRENPAI